MENARLTPAGSDSLLALDPDLGSGLDAETARAARDVVRVRLVKLEAGSARGKWGKPAPDLAGLLVIEGAVVRRVATVNRETAELLGPGDLLRPFEEDGEEDLPVHTEVHWKVVSPVTLAVIDGPVLQVAARWPPVAAAIAARGVRRAQRQSVNFSISHLVRIEDRLLLLFWHMADRWGRVSPDGVRLDLPLTHATLALMVGAERPSVSSALGRLAERGLIARLESGGWRLRGLVPDNVGALLARPPVH